MINWPKLCFRVIRPRIISLRRITSFILPFISLSFHFLWFSIFFFSIFLFYFFSFLFFLWSELNTFLELHFSHLPFHIRHLNHSWFERIFSRICPQCGGEPWSGWRRKLSGSKGRLSNNFPYRWRNSEKWSFFISNTVT